MLTDMGFLPNRATKAWAIMGNRGVQAAMDWLLEHNEDPDIDEPYKAPEGNVLGGGGGSSTPIVNETSSVPTNSENPEVVKPQMTPEEKMEQTRKLQERINQKRLENEELERKRQIESEKKRREEGKSLAQIKADIDFKEAQKLAAERRREKREDALARQRVKDEIARDRAEKKARLEREKLMKANNASAAPPAPTQQLPMPIASSTSSTHTHARLQIRLPDGTTLKETFSSTEQLAAVRLYIEMNRKDGSSTDFDLMTTFPRRVFTEEEYNHPLSELGLSPSANVIVKSKS